MRTFFKKKKYIKFVSALLAFCLLIGSFGIPAVVQADDETVVGRNVPSIYDANTNPEGKIWNKQLSTMTEVEEGVRVTYTGTTDAWARVYTKDQYSLVGEGFNIEYTDITPADGNYSLWFAFGQSSAEGDPFYNSASYVVYYDNDGDFAVIKGSTSTSKPNGAEVLFAKKLDPLGTELSLNFRKSADNTQTIITVNGVECAISDTNTTSRTFNMGLMSGFNIDYETKELSGMQYWQKVSNFSSSDISFTISSFRYEYTLSLDQSELIIAPNGTATLTANISNVIWSSSNTDIAMVENGVVTAIARGTAIITACTADGKTAECKVIVGERSINAPSIYNETANPDGKIWNKQLTTMEDVFQGVKVTYTGTTEVYRRVYTKDQYSLTGEGFNIEYTDITPADGNYSLWFAFGQSSSTGDPFYNSAAYVAYYDNDGDFAVIKGSTNTTRPNGAEVLYAAKLDPLGTELSINFRKSMDNTQTIITVNGVECAIPDSDTSSRTFNMGLMSGFDMDYDTNTISNMKYYQTVSTFSSDNISFTISNFQYAFGISVNPSVTLLKGTEAQLTATLTPEHITNQDMIWVSEDPSIVTVLDEKNGVIKGVAEGETTVTVTTDVGGKSATCRVTVVDEATGGYFSTSGLELKESDNKITAEYVAGSEAVFEQIHTETAYDAEKGIHLEIPSVTIPDGTDYTVAVAFGNDYVQGYNKDGYIIAYNRAGYFGVFATEDGQEYPIDEANRLVMVKRENFSGSLTLDLIQQNDTYVLTVNGATYSIPVLEGDKELYFAISLLGGAELETDADGNSRWVGVAWDCVTFGDGTSLVLKQISNAYSAPTLPKVDDVDKAEFITADEMVMKAGKFDVKDKKGLKITYNSESNYYSRMVTTTTHSTRTGIHIELTDIVPPEAWGDDYSIGMSFGNSDEQWFNQCGYMMVYDNQGNFQIVATKAGSDFNYKNRETVIYVKREPLEDSLVVDLKRQNDLFILTVNGKTYTLVAENDIYPLTSTKNLYIGFGIMDGGKIGTSEFRITKGNDGSLIGATYTIKKVFSVEDLSQDDKNIPPAWLGYSGSGFTFKEVEEGAEVTHVLGAAAWERFKVRTPYLTEGQGVTLELKDIFSESDDYSIVIGFGGTGHIWYENKGVMLLYGKSGNMALLAPSGIKKADGGVENQNDAAVIASDKLTFKDTLTVNVRTSGDNFIFTINGNEYVVDGEYLDYSNQVYFQLGVMGDFDLYNGDVSNLEYWQSGFRNKPVSFIVKQPIGNVATDEPIPGTPVDPADYGMFFVREDEHLLLYEADNGLKFVHTADALGWERISYKKRFSPLGNGIHLELEDITSKANRYTVGVFFGDDTWYNSNGYMILYGKDGNFAIVANDGSKVDPNKSPVVVSEVREELGDKLTIDIKLKNKNYVVTVNGKSYTVPAQYGDIAIKDSESLKVGFGVLGGGKIGSLNTRSKGKNNYVSFVIAKATGMIDPEFGKAFGMSVSGYNWTLEKVSKGTKVTHGVDGAGWERVSLNDSYATTEGGIHIKVVDITSKDANYSLAVMLGDKSAPWCDTTGYMLIYGKSGNFAIIATDSSVINPNKSAVVVAEVREALGKTLSINVRLSGENYKITVNDKTYTVPAEHEKYPLTDVENLYISFGEFNDDEIGKLVYNKAFKKSELSFVVSSVYHSTESVKDEEATEEEEDKTTVAPGKRPSNITGNKEEQSSVNVIAVVGVAGGVLLISVVVVGFILWKKKKKRNVKQSMDV